MIYLLIAYSIIVTILAKYFYDQWKENEYLFELSKGYAGKAQESVNNIANLHYDSLRLGRGYNKSPVIKVASVAGMTKGMAVTILDEKGIHKQGIVLDTPKLNKDGSIAKKRGRKSNVKAV